MLINTKPVSAGAYQWIVTEDGTYAGTVLSAKAKTIAYNGVVYLSENAPLVVGDRFVINGETFKATSVPYGSSTYGGYPYAINTNNASTSGENQNITMATPQLSALNI